MSTQPRSSLLQHRILLLAGPINAETSSYIVTGLLLLNADNHRTPIDLYVNSIGGGVADAMAIVDAIHAVRSPVHTTCIGQAVSTAAWVLMAGAKGHRAATPNALIMIRDLPFRGQDSSGDTEIYAYQAMRDRVNTYLAEWIGQPIDTLPSDRFLTAAEAKAHGIVDQVIEPFAKRRKPCGPSRSACHGVTKAVDVPTRSIPN